MAPPVSTSPNNSPWLVWKDQTGSLATGHGLDADNQWWTTYGPFANLMYLHPGANGAYRSPLPDSTWGNSTTPKPIVVPVVDGGFYYTDSMPNFPLRAWRGFAFSTGSPESSSDNFIDTLGKIVQNDIVPVILQAITVINPAVGAVATAVYLGALKIAAGAPLYDTTLNAIKNQLPSILDSTTFQDAYDKVLSDPNARVVQEGLAKVMQYGDLSLVQSYKAGVVVASAQAIQDRATEILRTRIPADKQGAFDQAVSNHASLTDLATGLLGVSRGIAVKAEALQLAAKQIGSPVTSLSAAGVNPGPGAKPGVNPGPGAKPVPGGGGLSGLGWILALFAAGGAGFYFWRHRRA